MNRRRFIKQVAAGVSGLSVGLKASAARARAGGSSDVVVFGAGIFGVWTAYTLQRQGVSVTLVDPLGPGNIRSGSGGATRMIQTDSDTDAYIRSCVAAFPLWKEAEQRSGQKFIHEIGRLRLEINDKQLERAKQRQQNLRRHGVTDTEILTGDEVRKRWPQIRGDDIHFASFNSCGPGGSTLMAASSCQAVADLFVKDGGRIVKGRAPRITQEEGPLNGVRLDGGETVQADRYVFACGWNLGEVFPDLINDRVIVEQRDVYLYKAGSHAAKLTQPHLPAWSVPEQNVYGFPAMQGAGFKVAPSYDPRTAPNLHADMDRFTYDRFPALAGAPLEGIRKCWVDLTIDYDFIVDRHPTLEKVFLVAGGSGHGAKHGPSIGVEAAGMVMGEARDPEFAKLYQLDERKFDLSQKKRFDDK